MKNKEININDFFVILSKALRISLKVRSGPGLWIGIAGFPMALLPTLISLILQRFTDEVQRLYGMGREHMQRVLVLFGVLTGCYFLQTIFHNARSYYSKATAVEIKEYIKERALQCVCHVKYKYMDNEDEFLNKISFIKTESGQRVANSIENILQWFQNLIAFISMMIVLLQINVLIVIVLLLTAIPAVILTSAQKDEDYRRKTKWMKEGRLVISQFHDCCAQYSLNEVRFFGLFNFLKSKWRENADIYIDIKNCMTKKHVKWNLIADFLRSAVYVVILMIVVRQVVSSPEVGLGIFVLVMSIAKDFQKTSTELFLVMSQFASDIKYMKDFFELEELEYEANGADKTDKSVDILFDHVNFSYPGSDEIVLSNIDVCIRYGEKVAIVGENGSGKTTFVNLILGLYEPIEGSVKIGNSVITETLDACRKNISVVFQKFAKYEMSILDNIIISDYNRPRNEETINQLVKSIGLGEIIKSQRNGINELVGSLSDGGNNLSGGQWQRIAIARAAYRENAKIMILDEPTAALDPMAEAGIYEKFSELTGDRTTIFVSHRLGICKLVDRILVFDHGKIVEDGNHNELMKANGLYAKMYNAQAKWYK